MESIKKLKYKHYSKALYIFGVLLIIVSYMPLTSMYGCYSITSKIRNAIVIGDSGHLILASALANFFYSIQSTFLFMGIIIILTNSKLEDKIGLLDLLLLTFILIILLHILNPLVFKMPWESITTMGALTIALYLFKKLYYETKSYLQVFIVSIQVFFASYWLNVIPIFSFYRIGHTDIFYSIKITASYLHAESILNFVGLSFFTPFLISAFISATLFISYSQNINMMKINYEKENELRNIKARAVEDRIYQEINALAHDLKTPLVTISGLNSLFHSTEDKKKLKEYSVRIENSVNKMNEMISCFLYEKSRQNIGVMELASYIRAQLPLEDENIKFSFSIDDRQMLIYVNKVRVVRAIINILENAILAPCNHRYKEINIEAKRDGDNVLITIEDNAIGIKEADISSIWDVGFTTNNTSGLGLPFAKRIIEDNGGNIKIDSMLGIGTRVEILIPLINSQV